MNYELTVVLGGKATTAKKKSTKELVEKLVATKAGKVIKYEDWGEKEMSYPIHSRIAGKRTKFDTGTYLFFSIELSGEGAKTLTDKIANEEDFVRNLLVKVD